jgi:hypothetical protein
VKPTDYVSLPIGKRRSVIKAELQQVYAYPYWQEVLKCLRLPPVGVSAIQYIDNKPNAFGGGEGLAHLALKEYVAMNPALVGLGSKVGVGETEVPLLSGDTLDVSFRTENEWVAAEVKSHVSDVADIQRGLFQCIKYSAVMRAQALAEARNIDVRAVLVLVLGAVLPQNLLSLRNMLAIEVVENVLPID